MTSETIAASEDPATDPRIDDPRSRDALRLYPRWRAPLTCFHYLFARPPAAESISNRYGKTPQFSSEGGEGEAAGQPPRLFQRIQQYINTHLDSRLSNEELAASVGLSVSYFTRSFARSVGTTPHNYVVRLRVSRAQQLLAETDLTLTEIALTTGFSDQSHFSRRFLQLVGLQPKAFRKRHR